MCSTKKILSLILLIENWDWKVHIAQSIDALFQIFAWYLFKICCLYFSRPQIHVAYWILKGVTTKTVHCSPWLVLKSPRYCCLWEYMCGIAWLPVTKYNEIRKSTCFCPTMVNQKMVQCARIYLWWSCRYCGFLFLI